MIEEFDVIQSLNLSQQLLDAAVLLLIGIMLEVGLRFGRRWAMSRNLTWLSAVLGALTWQPLFWGLLLGIVLPSLEFIEDVAGWQRGQELISVLALISITIFVVRLISGLLTILTAATPSASVSLLNYVLTWVGLMVVVAIVLGYVFNLSFLVLLVATVGGIAGLSVVFQEPLNNLVSGVTLTVSSRLAPGDWIRLPSGSEGRVVDILWDVTLIQHISDNVIVVPNKTLTEIEITNYDRPNSEVRVTVAVGVSYDSDLARVEQVTLEEANKAMRQINGDVSTTEPVIRYNAFADSSINFNVLLKAKKFPNQYLLTHEFIKQLHQRYDDEGIVIPFPIRTLHAGSNRPLAMVSQAQPADGNPQQATKSEPTEVR